MSEAAWDKAFTQGSTALKNRLMKVHAKNPKFQSWLKSSGHGAGVSVKQASKEVKPTERVKALQTKSLKAYGATKGLKVGGEHGSGEMKDTIAPLTRDQHSKVQAAARAAKAAEKPVAAKKTPLTKSQRMAAIAAAVRKTQTKHDVPTMDPDDESHDDLRDLHQSLHIRKGYNEEVEQVDEIRIAGVLSAMEKARYNPQVGDKIRTRMGGQIPGTVTKVTDTHVHFTHPEGKKYKTSINNVMREEVELEEGKMKDIVTDRQETERLKAQEVLGGPVKSKASAIGGAGQPKNLRNLATRLAAKAMKTGAPVTEGYEYTNIGHPPEHSVDVDPEPATDPLKLTTKRKKPVQYKSGMRDGVTKESTEESQMKKGRVLALAVMKKNQSKHPIAQEMGEETVAEAIKDAADVGEYDYEGDMAKSQLRSILTNAKRMHDMLDDQTNLPEWVQSKITLAEDYILTAANYMEGEMNEEVEQIDEAKSDPAKQAARQYASSHKDLRVTSVRNDDKSEFQARFGHKGTMIYHVHHKDDDEGGGEEVAFSHHEGKINVYADPGGQAGQHIKPKEFDSVEHAVKHAHKVMPMPTNEEVEGSVPTTPKEKKLAKHHGDPNKITYGDVLKARLKSAAEKAMKKGN